MNNAYLIELDKELSAANRPKLTAMVRGLVTQLQIYERTESERSRMPEPAARAVTGYLPWMKAVKG